jgi:hypothetical protein
MQADVVHRGDRAADVSDADSLFAAGEFFGFIRGGKFGLRGEFNQGHSRCLCGEYRRASLGWTAGGGCPYMVRLAEGWQLQPDILRFPQDSC